MKVPLPLLRMASTGVQGPELPPSRPTVAATSGRDRLVKVSRVYWESFLKTIRCMHLMYQRDIFSRCDLGPETSQAPEKKNRKLSFSTKANFPLRKTLGFVHWTSAWSLGSFNLIKHASGIKTKGFAYTSVTSIYKQTQLYLFNSSNFSMPMNKPPTSASHMRASPW